MAKTDRLTNPIRRSDLTPGLHPSSRRARTRARGGQAAPLTARQLWADRTGTERAVLLLALTATLLLLALMALGAVR
jgi:hypothetical protein